MGPDPAIVYISSDDDENDSVKNFCKKRRSFGDSGSEDDCLMLDFDPNKEIFDGKWEGDDEDSDDLVIVNERGQVACRDYPHSRHLCAKYPFNASRHDKYCSLCHCYVCDIPAPCKFWGNGKLTTDHCHSTDKGDQWKELRVSFKENNMAFEKFQNITQSNLQLVQNLLPSHPANSTLVAPAWPRSSASNKVVTTASNEVLKETQSTSQPVQNTVLPCRSPVSMTTTPRFSASNNVVSAASNKVLEKTQSTIQPVQNIVLPHLSPVSMTIPRSSASNKVVSAASNKALKKTQSTSKPIQNIVLPCRNPVSMAASNKVESAASNKVLKKTKSSQPVQNAVLPCRRPVSTNTPRSNASNKVESAASNKVLMKTQSTSSQPVLVTIASPKSSLVRKQAGVGNSGALTGNSSNKRPRTSQACLNTDKPKSLPLKSMSSGLVQHSYNLRG